MRIEGRTELTEEEWSRITTRRKDAVAHMLATD